MGNKIVWKNCKQIAPVYETMDYGMFKEMAFNRDATERRVNKIIASFSEKEILNPIVINEKCEVVDGQGRFEALKRLGRPIKFVVAYGADINDCRRMNIYNTNWNWRDYINSYAKSGNWNYLRLKECAEEAGLSYRLTLRLVCANDGSSESSINHIVPQGLLKFTEEHVRAVRRLANCIKEIKEVLLLPKLNETLIMALKVCINTNGYDHQRMLRKCGMCRSSFRQMVSLEDMLAEMARIYNYKTTKDQLWFQDYMRNKGRNVQSYTETSNRFIDNTPNVKTLLPKE